MLQYQTVAPATLDLLKMIAAEPAFSAHRLVGGTALALQYGHRLSVDLDFFSDKPMEYEEIVASIKSFGRVEIASRSKFINSFFINDIKVDFVALPYAWLEAAVWQDGIRMGGIKDIGAMKLAAITNRGSKKDFIDISLLMNELGLHQMMDCYQQKYPDAMKMMVLRSLVFFEDAEAEADPVMLIPYDWNSVKAQIVAETRKLLSDRER